MQWGVRNRLEEKSDVLTQEVKKSTYLYSVVTQRKPEALEHQE